MAENGKLIKRIEARPIRTDITFKELSKYLCDKGFDKGSHKGGSHYKFMHHLLNRPLMISAHNETDLISAYQIKQVQEAMNVIKEKEK